MVVAGLELQDDVPGHCQPVLWQGEPPPSTARRWDNASGINSQGVDNSRYVAQEGEQAIYPEVGFQASFEEDTNAERM